jgi:hypothetical protein
MRVLGRRHRPGWLLGLWAVTLVIWVLVPVVKFASSWPERGIGIVLAVAYGVGFAFVMRLGFRRVAGQPPAYRGIGRLLVPLPAVVSASLIACLFVVVPAVMVVGTALLFRRLPFMNVWGLCLCFIFACGAGGFWPLAWREQRRTRA